MHVSRAIHESSAAALTQYNIITISKKRTQCRASNLQHSKCFFDGGYKVCAWIDCRRERRKKEKKKYDWCIRASSIAMWAHATRRVFWHAHNHRHVTMRPFVLCAKFSRWMRVAGWNIIFDLFSPRQHNPSSQCHHRCTQLYKHRFYIDKWVESARTTQFIKRRYGRLLYAKTNKRFNSENEMNHERQTTAHTHKMRQCCHWLRICQSRYRNTLKMTWIVYLNEWQS